MRRERQTVSDKDYRAERELEQARQAQRELNAKATAEDAARVRELTAAAERAERKNRRG